MKPHCATILLMVAALGCQSGRAEPTGVGGGDASRPDAAGTAGQGGGGAAGSTGGAAVAIGPDGGNGGGTDGGTDGGGGTGTGGGAISTGGAGGETSDASTCGCTGDGLVIEQTWDCYCRQVDCGVHLDTSLAAATAIDGPNAPFTCYRIEAYASCGLTLIRRYDTPTDGAVSVFDQTTGDLVGAAAFTDARIKSCPTDSSIPLAPTIEAGQFPPADCPVTSCTTTCNPSGLVPAPAVLGYPCAP